LRTEPGLAALRAAAAAHLSPAGQQQVGTALDMLAAVEARMGPLRKQLTETARHLTGAKVLAERLYGVGPVTGLDITVWSSDRKGPSGAAVPAGAAGAALGGL
jgi:hypothetical protein